MTTTQLRVLGGILILIDLVIIGTYNLTGFMVFALTFGVAIFFEYVLVRNFASDNKNTRHEP